MLTEQLTADAAALHQAILRHGGEVSPFFCGKELGWEHRRIALIQLGQVFQQLDVVHGVLINGAVESGFWS